MDIDTQGKAAGRYSRASERKAKCRLQSAVAASRLVCVKTHLKVHFQIWPRSRFLYWEMLMLAAMFEGGIFEVRMAAN